MPPGQGLEQAELGGDMLGRGRDRLEAQVLHAIAHERAIEVEQDLAQGHHEALGVQRVQAPRRVADGTTHRGSKGAKDLRARRGHGTKGGC